MPRDATETIWNYHTGTIMLGWWLWLSPLLSLSFNIIINDMIITIIMMTLSPLPLYIIFCYSDSDDEASKGDP